MAKNRVLGPESFGIVLYMLSLPTLAALAFLFGLHGAAWMPVLIETCICFGLCACIRAYCPQALRPQKAQQDAQP